MEKVGGRLCLNSLGWRILPPCVHVLTAFCFSSSVIGLPGPLGQPLAAVTALVVAATSADRLREVNKEVATGWRAQSAASGLHRGCH